MTDKGSPAPSGIRIWVILTQWPSWTIATTEKRINPFHLFRSTLLRTVHSVINRSPRHLLQEIILVDDASNRTFLKKPLQDYIDERWLRQTDLTIVLSGLTGCAFLYRHLVTFIEVKTYTVKHNINSCVRRIGRLNICFTCERCNMSSMNKISTRVMGTSFR